MKKIKTTPSAGKGTFCSNFRKTLLMLTLLFAGITVMAQQTDTPLHKIAPELLKQDFIALKDSLQKLHAGLYRYKSQAEMNSLFDSYFAELDHPMTDITYFAIVSELIGNIDDGQTECFLTASTINYLKANAAWFPLQIRFIGKRAYVPCNTSKFAAGTEIISINGLPVNQIRERLFTLLSSDGSNQTGKYVKINDGHDPFFFLYRVIYGDKASFKVSYKTMAGKTDTTTQYAASLEHLECPPADVKIDKYLQLAHKPGNIAVITIKTFANEYLDKTNENLATFLAASFKDLDDKKTDKLIIDLRDNGGGEDTNGALLYSYLTDKPFKYYAELESTTKKFTKDDHPNLNILQPQAMHFSGKVYFLISGKSFSGAAEFSSIAQSNARGTFIGEETGGGYYGNTSGRKTAIILPNSRIRVNIPLTKYVMDVKKVKYKDRGIIPNHIIVPTITDFIENKDVQMDYALHLAEKAPR